MYWWIIAVPLLMVICYVLGYSKAMMDAEDRKEETLHNENPRDGQTEEDWVKNAEEKPEWFKSTKK